jgi:hypothetical protein
MKYIILLTAALSLIPEPCNSSFAYMLQPKVTSKKQLDKIFSNFELVQAKNLNQKYLEFSNLSKKRYRHAFKNKKYYLIPKWALNQNILGSNKLKSIVSNGDHNGYIPLLIDKRVLYKFVSLYNILKKKGYNPDEIIITSGHRNPYHNEIDHGAPKSRHILGQALDFDVGDINRDGIANFKDKKIVYNILNKKLFKNHGGLGRYPHHEHALHIDTRTKKSRWDSY